MNLKSLQPIRWISIIGFSGLLSLLGHKSAAATSYCDFIHLNIFLESHSTLGITETQKCLFSDHEASEHYHSLPSNHTGWSTTKSITHIGINEIHRLKLTHKNINNENLESWPPQQRNTSAPQTQNFILRHKIVRGIDKQGPYSQIYWKNLWIDSKVPIKKGKITLRLPPSLSHKNTYFEVVNNTQNTEIISYQTSPNTFVILLNGPLTDKDTWSIRLVFPRQVHKIGTPQQYGKTNNRRKPNNPLIIFYYGFEVYKMILQTNILVIIWGMFHPWTWFTIVKLLRYRCPKCHRLNTMNKVSYFSQESSTEITKDNDDNAEQNLHRCSKCSYERIL